MKAILNIGGKVWACDSAKVAAQISDLIGTCTPLDRVYEASLKYRDEVYVEKETDDHHCSISQVNKNCIITDAKTAAKMVLEAAKKRDEEMEKRAAAVLVRPPAKEGQS